MEENSPQSALSQGSSPSAMLGPHGDTSGRCKNFILGSLAGREAPFSFPRPAEPRFSCWPPERNGNIRGPEGNQPIFSAGTVRGVLTGHVFTDRPNHINRKSVLSLQKAKPDLPHKANTTPFNKLPEPVKSNGTPHQVHTNQTNLPEIPQESLNRSLVEFCGV